MALTQQQILQTPGLFTAPNHVHLLETSNAYNCILDDHDQPDIPQFHLDNLAAIFAQYQVQSKLGLHLVHGHLKVAESHIMYGSKISEPDGIWTRPTSIHELDLNTIHGHIFMLTGDGQLVAYEYRDGPRLDLSDVNTQFFEEFIRYLQTHSLENLLGLQVLTEPPRQMVEFVLHEEGTVMLYEPDANHGAVSRHTGYYCSLDGEKPTFKVLDAHAETVTGTHRVFVKPGLPNIDALRDVLKHEKII